MSAEAFGAKLLSEVQQESLASLLSDLRAVIEPKPKSETGLIELDNIIDVYRFTSNSDTSRQHGQSSIPSDPNVFSEDDLDPVDDMDFGMPSPARVRMPTVKRAKPVVINLACPLHGPIAAVTSFLYHLTSISTLPYTLGGKQNAVVYIDCSNSFSALQLHRSTASHARNHDSVSGDITSVQTLNSMIKDALHHVHLRRCTSSRSLLQTLKCLPNYLLKLEAHQSSQRKLGLLIVDHINHFYWQDRFDAETARLENIHSGDATNPTQSSKPETLTSQILTELKAIQATFECTIFYTTTSVPSSTATYPQPETPQSRQTTSRLTSPSSTALDMFTRSALLTLHPTRKNIPQFAPHMTLEECLRDREKRDEALRKAGYWLTATPGGLSERRETSVQDGLQSKMGFGFKVLGDGAVQIEE